MCGHPVFWACKFSKGMDHMYLVSTLYGHKNQWSHCYSSHLTNEETWAQRSKQLAQGHTLWKWQRRDLKPEHPAFLQPELFTLMLYCLHHHYGFWLGAWYEPWDPVGWGDQGRLLGGGDGYTDPEEVNQAKEGHGYGWWPGQRASCPRQEGNQSNERPSFCLVDTNPLPSEEIPGQCYFILSPGHTTSSISGRGWGQERQRWWELSAIPLSRVRASTVSYPLSRDLAPSLMPESEIWPGEVQVTLWIKLRTQSTPTQDSLWTHFSFLWIEGTRAQCPVRSVASAGFCLSLWKSKQRVGSLWLNRVFYTQERPSGWLLMTLLQIYCLPNLRNILIPPRSPWAAILVCIATTLLMTETDSPPGTWCNKRERSADWSSAGSRPHTRQPWPTTPPSNWACWRSGKTHRRLFSSAYQG